MRRLLLLLLTLLPLTACSQAFEGRIASRLDEAGLSRPMSECMAERWVKRLGVFQLRRIQRLAEDLESEGENLTIAGLIGRVREMDDPEIVEVVTRSTVVCALTA
jgi:hypothetical protein